jgi:hypothetical protein
MKVLTIRQPWASLIVWNLKDVENRNWKTNYRGPLIIHAAGKFDEQYDKLREYPEDKTPANMFTGSQWSSLDNWQRRKIFDGDLPTSSIIGITTLKDIDYYWPGVSWAKQDYKYHWHLMNSIEFNQPIKNINGKMGLWNLDLRNLHTISL